jgi:hypothetical protein
MTVDRETAQTIYFNRSNMTKHLEFDHQQVSSNFGMLFLCK